MSMCKTRKSLCNRSVKQPPDRSFSHGNLLKSGRSRGIVWPKGPRNSISWRWSS